MHDDNETVPLVTVIEVPATKEALKETAVAETRQCVAEQCR